MNDQDVDNGHRIYERHLTQFVILCDMSVDTARCSFELFFFCRPSLPADSSKHLRSDTPCCSIDCSVKHVLNCLTTLTKTTVFKKPESSECLVDRKAKPKRQLIEDKISTRPTFNVPNGNINMEIDNELKREKMNELFKMNNLSDSIFIFGTC